MYQIKFDVDGDHVEFDTFYSPFTDISMVLCDYAEYRYWFLDEGFGWLSGTDRRFKATVIDQYGNMHRGSFSVELIPNFLTDD